MSLVISAPLPSAPRRGPERRANYASSPTRRTTSRPAARPVATSAKRSMAGPPATHRGSVRLTMRGRLVIFAGLLILALLAVTVGWLASSAVATDATVGGTTTEVVVQPGETLWQVAEEAAPSIDPRETVAVIMELNDLSTASVQAGQSLLVPVA